MRQYLAATSNAYALLPVALLGAVMVNAIPIDGHALEPTTPEATTAAAPACGLVDIVVREGDPSAPVVASPCAEHLRSAAEIADARAYLVDTAQPGYTMTRQGPELAIGRLHPEFALRLANAIREARIAGLPSAGIFSAYRPPAFGIGGFSDKFNSLHSYGLAVDMCCIGRPGSAEAQRWHEIAGKHGVICPYGFHNPAEWNHCQPTGLKIILPDNPLRETITADGPRSLEVMFGAGSIVIASAASATGAAVAPTAAAATTGPALAAAESAGRMPLRAALTSGNVKRKPRGADDDEGRSAKQARLAGKKVAKSDDDDDDNNKSRARREERHAAKSARPAGKKAAEADDDDDDSKGRARRAHAKPRVSEDDDRQRKRKSGRGSASLAVAHRST